MRLKDQVTVITGASRGIGRSIALRFAREGSRIAGMSTSEAALEEVASEIEFHRKRMRHGARVCGEALRC